MRTVISLVSEYDILPTTYSTRCFKQLCQNRKMEVLEILPYFWPKTRDKFDEIRRLRQASLFYKEAIREKYFRCVLNKSI